MKLVSSLLRAARLRILYIPVIRDHSIASRWLDFVATPDAIWHGDALIGKKIMNKEFELAGCDVSFSPRGSWPVEGGPLPWLEELHGFSWLRHVLAFNDSRVSAEHMQEFTEEWVDKSDELHPIAWQLDVMGERIASWLIYMPFMLRDADDAFKAKLWQSLVRQLIKLEKGLTRDNHQSSFAAIKGLLYGTLCVPYAAHLLPRTMQLLYKALDAKLLMDGGHIARSPSVQLRELKHLLEMRSALQKCAMRRSERLDQAILRMAAQLRFYLYGDGHLALFNDSILEDAGEIKSVLTRAGGEGGSGELSLSGFLRLLRADAQLMVDVAAPSRDRHRHYSASAFEFVASNERIIVNCGAYRGNDSGWRKVAKNTAAHSTLCVDDRNSWHLSDQAEAEEELPDIGCTHRDENGAAVMEIIFRDFAKYKGLTFTRNLALSADGEKLVGVDKLSAEEHFESKRSHTAILRFHLYPDVKVRRDGAGILLSCPSGAEWLFTSSADERVGIDESVYLGHDGKPNRTSQIVVSNVFERSTLEVEWSLVKQARKNLI